MASFVAADCSASSSCADGRPLLDLGDDDDLGKVKQAHGQTQHGRHHPETMVRNGEPPELQRDTFTILARVHKEGWFVEVGSISRRRGRWPPAKKTPIVEFFNYVSMSG